MPASITARWAFSYGGSMTRLEHKELISRINKHAPEHFDEHQLDLVFRELHTMGFAIVRNEFKITE